MLQVNLSPIREQNLLSMCIKIFSEATVNSQHLIAWADGSCISFVSKLLYVMFLSYNMICPLPLWLFVAVCLWRGQSHKLFTGCQKCLYSLIAAPMLADKSKIPASHHYKFNKDTGVCVCVCVANNFLILLRESYQSVVMFGWMSRETFLLWFSYFRMWGAGILLI